MGKRGKREVRREREGGRERKGGREREYRYAYGGQRMSL